MRTKLRDWLRQRPTSGADEVDFRSQPYVCGAIGRFDATHVDRLVRGSPTSVREIHRSATAVVFASTDLDRWQTGTGQGFLWNALAGNEQPSSWQAAAERRVAAGLHVSADQATLHTDALGMQDVFTRRLGEALYFAVRIDPLVRLDDAPMHTDWTAWASIYAVTSPLSDRTPFEEIRRMAAASAWVADGHIRATGFEPTWLAAEPDGTITADVAVESVARCVPGGDLAITLSGGWDSRLLAILARRHSNRISAWTTSGDDGRDRDLDLAGPVASALGIQHQTIVQDRESWLNELAPQAAYADVLADDDAPT